MVGWAFGALLEGLVGFGYPWAVVAPILVTLGLGKLAAIRVAALANNAPVSFGALGAPVIALAAVTGLPVGELSATIGQLTAVLALAPPFLLIFLVSGWRGLREGWPLALTAAVGYIAGQLPTSQFLGPYLPDVIGAVTSFAAVSLLLRVWTPPVTRSYGESENADGTGTLRAEPSELTGSTLFTPTGGIDLQANSAESPGSPTDTTAPTITEAATAASTATTGGGKHAAGTSTTSPGSGRRSSAVRALVPLGILIAVVLAWTGPWSPLPGITAFSLKVTAAGSLGGTVSASFAWTPFVAGTAIMVAWAGICAYLRPTRGQLAKAFADTARQMWVALLVAPLLFGLATVFSYAGLANSMARGFAALGSAFVLVAPILGWIAVALTGSNTAANTIFGAFALSVGRLLGAPLVLFPALNSVGAEIGKPIAPQTASVGVATIGMTGHEGQVIRHNISWTLALLAYLILIGLAYYTATS
jgi:lactate permease